MSDQWVCPCGWKGEEPLICPGISGGKVVDIIDIFCPNPGCNSERLTFVGSKEEKDKWWDDWFEKMNKEGKE